MTAMDWCKHKRLIALAAGYRENANTHWWLSGNSNSVWNFNNQRIELTEPICTDDKCPQSDTSHTATPSSHRPVALS